MAKSDYILGGILRTKHLGLWNRFIDSGISRATRDQIEHFFDTFHVNKLKMRSYLWIDCTVCEYKNFAWETDSQDFIPVVINSVFSIEEFWCSPSVVEKIPYFTLWYVQHIYLSHCTLYAYAEYTVYILQYCLNWTSIV